MAISSEIADGLTELEGDFPATFVWNSTSYTCIASAETRTVDVGEFGLEAEATLQLIVRLGQFGGGATPSERNKITFNSRIYRIEAIEKAPQKRLRYLPLHKESLVSYQSVPVMVEQAITTHLGQQSFVSNESVTVTDSYGGQLLELPSIRVTCLRTNEEPSQSGNFMAQVDLVVLGAVDPENADTFNENITKHNDIVGHVHRYVTATITPALINAALSSGYTNAITVYDIRFTGNERDINMETGSFEDVFGLEIYVAES